jgi:putative Mg2+ transporter-C (MgtC) family protein
MAFQIEFFQEDIIKLLISAGTGACIGFEREYHSKSAGLRTMILICLGATLFTLVSMKLGTDPSRVAANIVTGIGFVGGGIIFRDNSNSRITGITTAATAWVTAALGMCVGFGESLYGTGLVAMLLVVITLYSLVLVQDKIKSNNQIRTYRIVCKCDVAKLKFYETKFKAMGLEAKRGLQTKNELKISGQWSVQGSSKNHERMIEFLLSDTDIMEVDF